MTMGQSVTVEFPLSFTKVEVRVQFFAFWKKEKEDLDLSKVLQLLMKVLEPLVIILGVDTRGMRNGRKGRGRVRACGTVVFQMLYQSPAARSLIAPLSWSISGQDKVSEKDKIEEQIDDISDPEFEDISR